MAIANNLELLARDAILLGLGPAAAAPRELIVATGADRIRFLHGLVTGNVAGTEPGRGCRAVLLTLKGQVVSDMRIFVRADDVRIVVDAGQAAPVAAALARYAIMDDFAAAPAPDFAFLSLLGPSAAARLSAAGVDVRVLAALPPLSHAEIGGLWAVHLRELGADGYWLGGAPTAVAELRARLVAAGVAELDGAVAEAARIDALEPRFGVEITTDYFPMEVGLASAIDYTKGCYLGQEPIVRVRDRGHINWRLCGLDVAGDADPHPGDPLTSDAKPKAGRITSAARLPDGRGVALAMVHVSIPVGATVQVGRGDGSPLEARIRADA
jgi:folate-binding protein YgfZ